MQKFSPKDPEEVLPLTFDFQPYLESGETISSVAVLVTVHLGDDSNPNDILSGSAVITNAKVRQNVKEGLPGVEYLVRIVATKSTGFKAVLGGVLPVKLAGTY